MNEYWTHNNRNQMLNLYFCHSDTLGQYFLYMGSSTFYQRIENTQGTSFPSLPSRSFGVVMIGDIVSWSFKVAYPCFGLEYKGTNSLKYQWYQHYYNLSQILNYTVTMKFCWFSLQTIYLTFIFVRRISKLTVGSASYMETFRFSPRFQTTAHTTAGHLRVYYATSITKVTNSIYHSYFCFSGKIGCQTSTKKCCNWSNYIFLTFGSIFPTTHFSRSSIFKIQFRPVRFRQVVFHLHLRFFRTLLSLFVGIITQQK